MAASNKMYLALGALAAVGIYLYLHRGSGVGTAKPPSQIPAALPVGGCPSGSCYDPYIGCGPC